jgi:hypothetical protein
LQRRSIQATIAEKSPPPTMSLSALTFSPLTKPTTQDSKAAFTTKFFFLFSQAVQDCEPAPTIVDPAFSDVGKSSIITMASARLISSSVENGYFQGGSICCFARRRKLSFGFSMRLRMGMDASTADRYLRLESGQ